ncbi:hypothetical protein HYALB_00004104 [Hymenoscyphus albidus]|uniref:Uncharacterized protein n=1 Tax=Hymenoscyphus albidus TaxID=595503 RepID=A0A9N9QDL8_9HELO|nr:hypothetical protein HYALB_00004104 [Hymenoscyphus albidus]
MATLHHAHTPPPSSAIRTPSTPRFGTFADDYQPYSPRKSSRVAQRSRASTPPPREVTKHDLRSSPKSKKKSSSASASRMLDTPAPPHATPKKRTSRALPESGARRVPGALEFPSMSSATSSLGLPTPTTRADKMDIPRPNGGSRNNGMLPTPAKTPSRRPDAKNPAFSGISRSLFTSRTDVLDDVMPSPRKKNGRRGNAGFTLDSFDDAEGSILIYTDSTDRVPEADHSLDNPFYGEGAASPAQPVRRTSKRRKVIIPGEGEQDIDDVKDREDGMAYIFRGKKFWRSHEKNDAMVNESDDEDGPDLVGDLDIEHLGPMTRSSIKPRLLYPTDKQIEARKQRIQVVEEEEADTDIEEPAKTITRSPKKSLRFSMNETPAGQLVEEVSTPKAPRFAASALTPPTTARTTRSKKMDVSRDMRSTPEPDASSEEDGPKTPVRATRSTRSTPSPFKAWQQLETDETKATKKRGGDSMARPIAAKRPRH